MQGALFVTSNFKPDYGDIDWALLLPIPLHYHQLGARVSVILRFTTSKCLISVLTCAKLLPTYTAHSAAFRTSQRRTSQLWILSLSYPHWDCKEQWVLKRAKNSSTSSMWKIPHFRNNVISHGTWACWLSSCEASSLNSLRNFWLSESWVEMYSPRWGLSVPQEILLSMFQYRSSLSPRLKPLFIGL